MTDWVTLRDQLNLSLKPIDAWPGKMTPSWQREKGPFTAGLKDTLAILRKEIRALDARSIVLQIAIKPAQLRLDGLPRAGATAEHPGVILAFNCRRGPLRIWFDRFTLWHNNLRAIALHLEHLRLATLYGVGEDGQAYRGWTAIPAPDTPAGNPPSGTTRAAAATSATPNLGAQEAAARAISQISGRNWHDILHHRDQFAAAFREASARVATTEGTHSEEMIALNHAADILKKRHYQ